MITSTGLSVAIGHSDDVDEEDAMAEVLAACEAKLAGAFPRGGILMSTVAYEHQDLVDAVAERYPGMPLIGATGDGTFDSDTGYREDSVLLMLFAGEELEFRSGFGVGVEADGRGATMRAIEAARPKSSSKPDCVFVFHDGLKGNADIVLGAIQERFGMDVPIVGGTAGDHWRFERSVQWCGDRVSSDAVAVLLVYGGMKLGIGVESGWVPIGEPMTVTRSDGHIVGELDGRPAYDVFHDRFGDLVDTSFGEYPLAVYPNPDSDRFYLRAVYRADKPNGAIIFAASVPEGARVRLTSVVRERIVDGAQASANTAASNWDGSKPALAFVVSCAARKWLMGAQAAQEYATVQESLSAHGVDVPIAGFFSFGEIAPLEGRNRFHNETCVTLILGT